MWLINAFVALFLSVLLYCGLSYLLEDVIDLRIESVNGIVLFACLYFSTYWSIEPLTKGY